MAKKSALTAIADLKTQMAKLATDGIAELTEEFNEAKAKADEAAQAALQKMKDLDAQIVELGGSSLLPKATKGRKPSGAAKPTANAYTGNGKDVAKFIAENAGTDGVATRRLTSEFGKPVDGWDTLLNGAAKLKGSGPGGRWFPA